MWERSSINVHSNTLPHLPLQNWEPAGLIGDFEDFFNGLAKRSVCLHGVCMPVCPRSA